MTTKYADEFISELYTRQRACTSYSSWNQMAGGWSTYLDGHATLSQHGHKERTSWWHAEPRAVQNGDVALPEGEGTREPSAGLVGRMAHL